MIGATIETNGFHARDSRTRKIKSPPVRGGKRADRVALHRIALATWLFAMAGCILTISLPHLQDGMVRLLGSGALAGWSLAVVFDLSQVACEIVLMAVPHFGLAPHDSFRAKSVIVSCTVISVAFNVQAFMGNSVGVFGHVSAVVLGAALPLGVLILSYLGAACLMGRQRVSSKIHQGKRGRS